MCLQRTPKACIIVCQIQWSWHHVLHTTNAFIICIVLIFRYTSSCPVFSCGFRGVYFGTLLFGWLMWLPVCYRCRATVSLCATQRGLLMLRTGTHLSRAKSKCNDSIDAPYDLISSHLNSAVKDVQETTNKMPPVCRRFRVSILKRRSVLQLLCENATFTFQTNCR